METQETTSEDVFDDLCRSTPPVEEPTDTPDLDTSIPPKEDTVQPPNPPLDSLDLYKRQEPPNPPRDSLDLYKRTEPPSPVSTSPDLQPSDKRTRVIQEELDPMVIARDTPVPEMATDDQGPLDSFDRTCTQTQGPPTIRTDYDHLSYSDLHELCKQRGYARKDSKASLCTRLKKMDEVASSRAQAAKRSRAHQDDQEVSELPVMQRGSGKRRRKADAHMNFAANMEILKQHAQWWDKGMQIFWDNRRIHAEMDMLAAASAQEAEVCNKILGRELTPEEEEKFVKEVDAAKRRELDAWSHFRVFSPCAPAKCTKSVVGTRWVLTWKMVEGVKTVKARLVAKGYQDPDLQEGLVETSGSVSLRSSHLQVISLAALRRWKLWSIDKKNAFLQADGFARVVFVQAPPEWSPGDHRRIWKLNAPAYGLNDAPVAFHRSLKRFLLNDKESLKAVDIRLEVSKFDPCLFFVFRGSGPAVGVMTSHIDDLLGCGEQDILAKMEKFLAGRFGPVKIQKDDFQHLGMDIVQKLDGSVEVSQKNFTDLLSPIETSPSLWKDRNRPLDDEELQVCQSKLGELCWLATVSRPDICARLARFSSNINGLQVIDMYRINDLIKKVKMGQDDYNLKYQAGMLANSRPSLQNPDRDWGKTTPIHENTMMMVGWSDAAFGTHTQEGRCRLGYIIGLMSSALTGPVHILQWTSKFTRKHVKSSLGGEIFALSEMWDHMEMIMDFYAPLGHAKIRAYGIIDCESLLSHLRTGRLGTEKFLTRHFRSIMDALDGGDLGNVAWTPGTENPADGLTKTSSELDPLLDLLKTGKYRPRTLEQLRGVTFVEDTM